MKTKKFSVRRAGQQNSGCSTLLDGQEKLSLQSAKGGRIGDEKSCKNKDGDTHSESQRNKLRPAVVTL